jgi:hypothetical protein
MAKLSAIFENIHEQDIKKQKYYAEKITEHFMLMEGDIDEAYDIDFIERQIIKESLKKPTLDETLLFVDGIMTHIDEGFVDNIVQGAKKIGTKIKNAITSLLDGPVAKELKKWNLDIIAAANKLEGLNDSLINLNDDYLFEGMSWDEINDVTDEISSDNTSSSAPSPDNDSEVTYTNAAASMIGKLFAGKQVKTGKKTGSKQKRLMFYAITKVGTDSTLWVGSSNDITTMNALLIFKKASSKLYMNIDTSIIESQLEMKLIHDLLMAIQSNPEINVDGVYRGIKQNGNKILLVHGNKNMKIMPGLNYILSIGSKSQLPIKKTASATPDQFIMDNGVEKPASGEEEPSGDSLEDNAVDDVSTEEEEDLAPNVVVNKKIIMSAITKNGIQNNTDGFYDKMRTTPEKTWKAFESFAKRNNYKITSILRNTNGDLNSAAPMEDLEYLTYVGNMKQFINALTEEDPQPAFDPNDYKRFMNAVSVATDKLAMLVNRENIIPPTDADDNGKIGSNNDTGSQTSDTPTQDDTSGENNSGTDIASPNVDSGLNTFSNSSKEELLKRLSELSPVELQYILSKVEK